MSRTWIRALALTAICGLFASAALLAEPAAPKKDKPAAAPIAAKKQPAEKKQATEPAEETEKSQKEKPAEETDDDTVLPVNEVAAFMRLKLEHAQSVLEGLAVKDFDLIAKHSQQLSLLTKDEMWQVIHSEAYLQFSDDFARSADRITKEARAGNLDGAALAYMQVTLGCVNCHKYTRDVRMADKGGE